MGQSGRSEPTQAPTERFHLVLGRAAASAEEAGDHCTLDRQHTEADWGSVANDGVLPSLPRLMPAPRRPLNSLAGETEGRGEGGGHAERASGSVWRRAACRCWTRSTTANDHSFTAPPCSQTDAEKHPYHEAHDREKRVYERAMAAYTPLPEVWISGHPTKEQERLYAKPIASWRAKIERQRQRRRAAAQKRAEEQVRAWMETAWLLFTRRTDCWDPLCFRISAILPSAHARTERPSTTPPPPPP
jgi:hypothetical protein